MSNKRYNVMSYSLDVEGQTGPFVKHEDYAALEQQLAESQSKLEKMAAENAGLREYRPQPSGAAMMEALDAFYEYHEDVPEQGMMAAFEILCCKRPATPETDAFLAEVRASGIDQWIASRDGRWNGTTKEAERFAAQLRQVGAA